MIEQTYCDIEIKIKKSLLDQLTQNYRLYSSKIKKLFSKKQPLPAGYGKDFDPTYAKELEEDLEREENYKNACLSSGGKWKTCGPSTYDPSICQLGIAPYFVGVGPSVCVPYCQCPPGTCWYKEDCIPNPEWHNKFK